MVEAWKIRSLPAASSLDGCAASRMELTRKFSPEASWRSYLLRTVLRAINKLYYTSHGVFHESFIGDATGSARRYPS